MDEISAHGPNGTPSNKEVKALATPVEELIIKNSIKVNEKSATATKKVVTLTIKDRFLQGITEAAKEKNLTIPQYIIETLENQMIKEEKLPGWWHTRQF